MSRRAAGKPATAARQRSASRSDDKISNGIARSGQKRSGSVAPFRHQRMAEHEALENVESAFGGMPVAVGVLAAFKLGTKTGVFDREADRLDDRSLIEI